MGKVTLARGSRLGPYENQSKLGAGGMGEVWRASDTRLGRDVAIKILPESFSADHDRLRRFHLEMQAASALNHPNILTVHDAGTFEGAPYVVSELLEGVTLRSALAGGTRSNRQMLDEAVQIAHGLAAAHDRGIVHRDLKPENVFVCLDGRVKILDFGLAKLVSTTPGDAANRDSTLSIGTPGGAVLGTPGYMSPEQVRGDGVDARSDLFSFGAVLFEMFTGRRAFHGATPADTLSAILRDPPPEWIGSGDRKPPPALDRIVRRCLEKSVARRFQSAHDLAFVLENLALEPEEREARAAVLPSATTHSVLPLPEGTHLSGDGSVLAISRDGTKLAFVAQEADGASHLFVTHLNRGDTQRIPVSESAVGPFFSPDGGWVAFAADLSPSSPRPGELRKHSFSTGLTQSVCPLTEFDGGTFGDDGDIYFVGVSADGLRRVRSAGGGEEPAVREYRVGNLVGSRCIGSPRHLFDGRSILIKDWDGSLLGDASLLDLVTGEIHALGGGGSFAVAVPTGHLLFPRADGVLYAAPWDPGRASLRGAPAAVIRGISLDSNGGAFAVSDSGILVYATGPLRGSVFEPKRVVRLDASGHETWGSPPIEAIAAPPSLSPDGASVAVASRVHGIWVFDVERGTRIRLPVGTARLPRSPVWSPDGARVIFRGAWVGEMGFKVFQQSLDGSTEPELLYGGDASDKRPRGFAPDGASLLWETPASKGGYELWEFAMGGAQTPLRVFAGPIEASSLSPDGRWLAYQSGRIGSVEIFVRSRADRSRTVQVSTEGGQLACWSQDGRELFYICEDRLCAVTFEEGEGRPKLGSPRLVFQRDGIEGYAVLPGSNGFITVERVPESGEVRHLQLVTGWFAELARVAPISPVGSPRRLIGAGP